MFGLGLFGREDLLTAHIIAPQGEKCHLDVSNFSTGLLKNRLVDTVYLRHFSSGDVVAFKEVGFRALSSASAWHIQAPFEDETYNHRIIKLEDLVGFDCTQKILIKSLPDGDSKNFRNKFRLAFQRARNFLTRPCNNLSFECRPLKVEDIPSARNLIRNHFAKLEEAGKAVGSCALDMNCC